MRSLLCCSLLPTALLLLAPLDALAQRSIDGTGNHPLDLGAAGDQLIRLSPEAYGDGISSPAGAGRPGARAVSNAVSAQGGSKPDIGLLTDMFWLWGQFVDHDIDLTPGADPAEPFPIPVPFGDLFFDPFELGGQEIGFERSIWDLSTGTGVANPRQQSNVITAFLDGSMVYGSDSARANFLRLNDGSGRLKTSAGALLPFNTGGFDNANGGPLPATDLFLAGDIRANENVALSAMHTIFVREHNRKADEIAAANPGMSGNDIYESARAWVIAEIQAVTYNEFLPTLLGPGSLAPYLGYSPAVDPQISNEFSTAAYRFGHSMLSETLRRLDPFGNTAPEGDLPLASAFFNPGEITANGVESILRGVANSRAETIDTQIVGAVRNFLFGPPGAGGLDLASLNIQRGRDHGIGSYNTVRLARGLPAAATFAAISPDPDVQAALAAEYSSVDDVDLWVGGLAESPSGASKLGETLSDILVDQFERLRNGDSFWYELTYSGAELDELNSTSLAEIIERNADVELQDAVYSIPAFVSFAYVSALGNELLHGTTVRPVDAVNVATGDLLFDAFSDEFIEDIDAFHVLPSGEMVFSTSTDVPQGFGGIPAVLNGDLVLWNGRNASILFSEQDGFDGENQNIDAFSVLPNGNWILSTDLTATLGGLTFENGDIVEYDPDTDVAALYSGLDEASIFTGANADIDALHVFADAKIVLSVRSNGAGQIGNGVSYSVADAPSEDLFELDSQTGEANVFLEGSSLFDGEGRNLDAIYVPEPGFASQIGTGIWALWGMNRRRRSSSHSS